MFRKRFARQYYYELPPEFLLASPDTGIVRNLSGLSILAQTHGRPKPPWPMLHQSTLLRSPGWHVFRFRYALGCDGTLRLASMLNSLVRVSRRDEWDQR